MLSLVRGALYIIGYNKEIGASQLRMHARLQEVIKYLNGDLGSVGVLGVFLCIAPQTAECIDIHVNVDNVKGPLTMYRLRLMPYQLVPQCFNVMATPMYEVNSQYDIEGIPITQVHSIHLLLYLPYSTVIAVNIILSCLHGCCMLS